MTAPVVANVFEQDRRCEDALKLLDEVHYLFLTRPPATSMCRLVSGLHDMRKHLPTHEWRLLKDSWMHHPVAKIVLQDPFTSWSYRKLRGYSGDARLLDFIYGESNIVDSISAASDIGREIYGFTREASACVAVRERRSILAALVDRVAKDRNRPISVLSIASGHLREAEHARALVDRRIERWVALDQDCESVAHVRKAFPLAVVAMEGSVRGILAERYDLGSFDLIYAAGLYDYLNLKIAKRLTEVAFRMLRPGGAMLYANFVRGIHDDGYMETFMDWQLIFRDRNDMEEIWSGLPSTDVASRELFTDSNKTVIYAIVRKT